VSAVEEQAAHPKPVARLRFGVLGLIETTGQSLAAIAPTLTPTLNITVVAGLAGLGCWMAYLIGTVGVAIVGASIGILAARHPETGSYFIYIGRTFGPFAGAMAGWSMISAYVFTGIATTQTFAIFVGNFLRLAGLPPSPVAIGVAMVLFLLLVCHAAYRDIRLSARIGLVLEFISVGIIIAITALIVRARGTLYDAAQLDIAHLHAGSIFSALPFVIFSFVGFESAAVLARESANPRRNIPLAVTRSAAACGIFFTITAYCMVLGVDNDTTALGNSSAPFADAAARAGLASVSMLVYFAAMISVFACGLASINAGSRLLFSMGKYRFLHPSMGSIHEAHRTPHVAVVLCSLLVAAISLGTLPLGILNAFGYCGTFASFSFVGVYLMLCIVAPLDLRRAGEQRVRHVVVGLAGAALMLFVIGGSLYPVPAWPYNILPFLFFGYLLAGALWFARLRARAPDILASIQHDMES